MMKKTAIVLFSALVFTMGLITNPALAEQNGREDTFQQLVIFGDVFEQIRANYVTEVSEEEIIEAAINGMLTSLDPHSSYLNPDDFEDMQVQTRGEFGGLGIEVTMENGLVKVVSPIDDTPAFRAGLQTGDFISHLDGEPIRGLTLNEAVDLMRGEVGTSIRITILREGVEPFDVTITRDIIRIRSVRHRVEEGNIGYVRVTTFNANASSGVQEAIAQIQEEAEGEIVGYVLDLRNNPGGLLDEAVNLSDIFLEQGEVVSTGGRIEGSATRFNATPGDLIEGKPLVVLINGGSASASEIVAGALQDHGRAIVMGEKSFGKGSVQTILTLSNRGAMRLTTAHYFTPSGRSIQATGIEPDIIVHPARLETYAARRGSREADLRGALMNPNQQGEVLEDEDVEDLDDREAGDGDEAEGEEEPFDYQLRRAIDLLRGLALYEQMQRG